MPISRDLLDDDEEAVVDLRLHWVFVSGPLALTVVALAVAIAVAVEFPNAPTAVSWILAAMVIVPAVWFVGRVTRWLGINLIVTTQRLILRRGVLGRDVVQLRLQRITEVHSVQNIRERIVGAGRLIVEVQGENQAVVIDDVRRPRNIQRVLGGLLDDLERSVDDPTPPRGLPVHPGRPNRAAPANRAAPGSAFERAGAGIGSGRPTGPGPIPSGPPSPRAGTVADQLIQLDDLRRRGIVTEAEFAAKKTELLGRL